jgi:hypothetical protein
MNSNCFVYKLKITLFVFLVPVSVITFGQTSNPLNDKLLNNRERANNQLLTDRQLDYIKETYSEKVGIRNEFIFGKEYSSYYLRSKFKPLLDNDKKRTATIFTKSRVYKNLVLQYDTFLDELIYTDLSKTINFTYPEIALNKDLIDGFNLYFADDSLIFKNLRLPEASKMNLKEGYYEFAYKGRSTLLIRHTSAFFVREGRNEYIYSPERYISVGGTFYRIKSKGDLLKALEKKSAEIKKYMHMAHIRIRQSDKAQFIEILKYYDSLLTVSR